MNIPHELSCLFLEMYPKEIIGNVMVLLKGEKEVQMIFYRKKARFNLKFNCAFFVVVVGGSSKEWLGFALVQ